MDTYKKEFISQMIAIPSVGGSPEDGAPYGKAPRQALDTFLAKASEEGFSTGVLGDRVGYCEIGSGAKLMGIVCHLDVVPAGEGWETDPFTAVFADGNIYGRGIVDDKGPAMASFFAMKELKDIGAIPEDLRVRLILGTDEERTCSCVEYYDEHEELPDISITPDAEFPVIYAEKGILHVKVIDRNAAPSGVTAGGGQAANMVPPSAWLKIPSEGRIEAKGKTAHASKPDLGINAIELLVSDNKGKVSLPVFDFVAAYDPSAVCSVNDHSGALTSNIGMLHAGSDCSYVVIDIRYPVTASYDDVLANIRSQASAYGLEVEVMNHMGPICTDKSSSTVKALTEVWESHMTGFDGYREEYRSMYSEPLAIGGGTYARHMRNTIAFGIQTPWQEDQCHQANEHISINDFEKCIKVIRDAIIKIGSAIR